MGKFIYHKITGFILIYICWGGKNCCGFQELKRVDGYLPPGSRVPGILVPLGDPFACQPTCLTLAFPLKGKNKA
jgi:hypothetical protein